MVNIISDERRRNFFIVDNEIIRDLGAQLGPFAGWVYMALLYHADGKTRKAFPSLSRLAKETGMSRRKVVDCIAKLEQLGLIRVQHVTSQTGGHAANHYYICDLAVTGSYEPPQAELPDESDGAPRALPSASPAPPSAPHALPLVHDVHSNNTNLNKTQEQDSVAPNGATSGASPSPERQPRPRDGLFDALAQKLYAIPPGNAVAKDTAQRIGRAKKCLLTTYPDLSADEFLAACAHWQRKNRQRDGAPLNLPRDSAKLVAMIGAYRASITPASTTQCTVDSDPPELPIETPDFRVFGRDWQFLGMYKSLAASGEYDRLKREGLLLHD